MVKNKEIFVETTLYENHKILITSSQAGCILSGLEKFSIVVFDFDNVKVIGQAFADEIFRVFHTKYPVLKLETKNMNENVLFMVKHTINEAKKLQNQS